MSAGRTPALLDFQMELPTPFTSCGRREIQRVSSRAANRVLCSQAVARGSSAKQLGRAAVVARVQPPVSELIKQ